METRERVQWNVGKSLFCALAFVVACLTGCSDDADGEAASAEPSVDAVGQVDSLSPVEGEPGALPADAAQAHDGDAGEGADIGEVGDSGAEPSSEPSGEPAVAEPSPAAEPDASAVLFLPDHVLEVAITMDEEAWDELRFQTRDFLDFILGEGCLDKPPADVFDYFPADVSVDGEIVENVGLRKKGFLGSLSDEKPSLKVKFNEYQEGQELYGLTRMTFNNMQQDPSRMLACLSYGVFTAAGYPAPRCSFAHLSVNGDPLGIYAHVDSVKKPYLARHFEDDGGNLYEGTLSDFREGWTGTYQKKTNKPEDDWSDIEAAVAALADDSDGWLEQVEALFDLDAFYTFWALETLVGHWDGYAGNTNNYYLYNDPSQERFVFLPWGIDSAFFPFGAGEEDIDYPPAVVANSQLTQKLFGEESTREQYLARMVEVLDSAWDEGHLLAETERMGALIAPYLSDSQVEAMWERVGWTQWFIGYQREAIEESMQFGGPQWHWPLPDPPCWIVHGEFQATFESEYGTLEAENGLEIGSLEYGTYEVDGEQQVFSDTGATSGEREPDVEAGEVCDGFCGLTFVLLGLADGGVLDFNVISMGPDVLEVGKPIPLDFEQAFGWRGLLPPPYVDLQFQGYLFGGSVTFDTLELEEGGTISGSMDAQLLDM